MSKAKPDKPDFHFERRLDLYLRLCQDPTLDRTAIHTAAVLLLKHANSHTAKTVPGRDAIADGMGRSVRAVSDGLRSLKVRWLRQVRRVGTSARYEWNWDAASAEDWQGSSINVQARQQDECADKAADSNRKTNLPIYIKLNLEEEKQEAQPGSSTSGDGEEVSPSVDSRTGNAPQSTITNSDLHFAQAGISDIGDSDPSDIAQHPISVPGSDFHTPHAHTPGNNGTPANTINAITPGNHLTPPEELFEQIWQLWPPSNHSLNRKMAHKAFMRAVKAGTHPEVILAGAKHYAAYRASKNEPQYTMTITRWLEEEHWNDKLPDLTAPATIDQHGNPISVPTQPALSAFDQSIINGIRRSRTERSTFISLLPRLSSSSNGKGENQ